MSKIWFNKKLLLAAFYQLTYQHDSKDFNICNYLPVSGVLIKTVPPAVGVRSGIMGGGVPGGAGGRVGGRTLFEAVRVVIGIVSLVVASQETH